MSKLNQKIAFSILCAKQVYQDPSWNLWADNWLNGSDRSSIKAADAASAAYCAAATASYAVADAANKSIQYVLEHESNIDLLDLAEQALKY